MMWGSKQRLLSTPITASPTPVPASQGQMGGQQKAVEPWCLQGPGRENYLRVHNPSLPCRSWVKSPKCHSPKGQELEGARRGAEQVLSWQQLPTWGGDLRCWELQPWDGKPLALRLKTGGLQAVSDPLTYLLGLKSVLRKKMEPTFKNQEVLQYNPDFWFLLNNLTIPTAYSHMTAFSSSR